MNAAFYQCIAKGISGVFPEHWFGSLMLKPVSAQAQWVNIFLLVCVVIVAQRPASSRQQNTNILQQLHIKTCTYFERKILGTEESKMGGRKNYGQYLIKYSGFGNTENC